MTLSRSALTRVKMLASRLELPDPFSLEELCDAVARRRSRAIVLAALPLSAAGPCGLWLASEAADYICYEQHTSALHQQHIVLHEIGHILCGHSGSEALQEVLGGLTPLLSPETLRVMLARQHAGFQGTHEAEAEAFAYAILGRLDKRILDKRITDHREWAGLPGRILDALEG